MTPPVKVAETCRCGASTSVEVATVRTARRLVDDWRTAHPCDPAGDRGRTGATSVLPGPGRIGFGAAPDAVGPHRW